MNTPNFFLLILFSLILSCQSAVSTPPDMSDELDVKSIDQASGPNPDLADALQSGKEDIAVGDPDANSKSDSVSKCDSGCIVDSQFIGTFLRTDISPLVPPEVIVENGYSVYWITYKTNGRRARASITIPQGVEIPKSGWPIAINNPGTVGVADKCAVAFSISGSGLSGYFGARGWVGVTIDYPGLATSGKHVYLGLEEEGKASLDAVRAAKNLLKSLEIRFSGAAIISGLSQGGHATLAAASLQTDYAPELDIRAFATAGPASVFKEHWQPGININGPHLAYHALLTYAWKQKYGGNNPWSGEIETQIDKIMDEHCNYPTETTSLSERLGEDNAKIFNQDYIDAFKNGEFSNYYFLEKGFHENRVRAFKTEVPIRIYQGDLDAVVLREHTNELVAELKTLNPKIEYFTVAQGHHTDIAFSFLAVEQLRTEEVLKWLKDKVE